MEQQYMQQPNEQQMKQIQQQRQQQAEQAEMKEAALNQIMTPQARERLARIRLVKPEKADQIENYFIGLAQQGRVKQAIPESLIIETLEKLSATNTETTSIKFSRKTNALDDDW